MRKLLNVLLLITCILLQLSACGKQEEAEITNASEETFAATVETVTAENETVPEETKKIVETVPMIEYSMPEGEGVESADNFTDDSVKETQGTNEPTETIPPIVIEEEDCGCEYSKFMSLSAAEQEVYMNTYDSPLDFIEWSKKASAEHEGHNAAIQASGGNLDLSDYIN